MTFREEMSAQRTWNLVAHGYAAEIVPTFSRFAEDALDLAGLASGERVLDVATGPGTLALAAAARGARVSAIDFSPKMIDELGERVRAAGITTVEARVADAAALPFADGEFDAVFSMFALNLMANRGAAFREIRRVVRASGRAVVGTPGDMTRAPAFADIRAIVHRAIPELELEIDLPLTESDDLRREMQAVGFSHVEVRGDTRAFEFSSTAALWDIASRAGAPIVLARDAMPPDRWEKASAEIVRGLEQRFGEGPQRIELSVNLARATP